MSPRAHEIAAAILTVVSEYKPTTFDDEAYATESIIVDEIGEENDTKSVLGSFLIPMKYIRTKQSPSGETGYETTVMGRNYLAKSGGLNNKILKVDNVRHANITGTATIVQENDSSGTANIKISPDIYEQIKRYIDTQDYFHAIDESYKMVRERLRGLTRKEKATDIFNMNAESDEFHVELFGKEATTEPEKDFYRGVGYLNLAIQFLRNEKAHILAGDVEENLAIHYIALASLVYDLMNVGDKK